MRRFFAVGAVLGLMSLSVILGPASLQARQVPVPHEAVEWTWAEFPEKIDARLPDVLLEGDSISRNYYPFVVDALRGKANVFLFATSASVGDPRLAVQIKDYGALARRHFRVVHFSNGLHGWKMKDAQYRAGLPSYLAAIRAIAPGARFAWTTTTFLRNPTSDGGTNERVVIRNAAAAAEFRAGDIVVDDQNRLMADRHDLYQDDVHFGPAGAHIQALQVAAVVEKELGLCGNEDPTLRGDRKAGADAKREPDQRC